MKIGEFFQGSGLITPGDLKIALKAQEKSSNRLGEILLNSGVIPQDKFAPALARYFDLPHILLRDTYKDIKPEVIDIVPYELASRFKVIPIALEENVLTVATFDPLNLQAFDILCKKTGHKICCVVCPENEILEAIEYCYLNLPRLEAHINSFVDSNTVTSEPWQEQSLDENQFDAHDRPVVQYVKSLIVHAVNSRASDILIQPKQDIADLRLRVDGILCPINAPPKAMIPAITTRVKILAGLDIAERRLPQDGRFKVSIGQTTIDIRTSTFPTIYGESVVMRLLDTNQTLLGLEELGLQNNDVMTIRKLINHSYGLILVTGPTGSGKTTTLYTCLNEIKTAQKNIITLEDPVEYRLPFIQQTQVNPQIGLDFAKGLRSILRQDPDIIMVGEIRDKETAEIAINAALTGHLVFSTLHTNDAASAAVRLINMGVEPYLIISSLLGVVAQRLIRKVCPQCAEHYQVDADLGKKLGIPPEVKQLTRGKGCAKCLQSGYQGRLGIYELLVPNPAVHKCILENRSSEEIKIVAQKTGMRTLRQAAVEKFIEGITTPEEVLRITQETTEV